MVIVCEFSDFLDLGRGHGKAFENLANVRAVLHRDNSELIFLIDPHQECLGIVVEDTAGLRPVIFKATRLQVLVTALEEEVIFDKRLFFGFGHGSQGVVFSLEFSIEGVQSFCD